MSLKYLLDANTYIQAKNLYYRMSIVPGFWDWLDLQFGHGNAGSVKPVHIELVDYGDELSDWVKSRDTYFLDVSDDKTQDTYTEIVNYIATNKYYAEPHVSNFLGGADPWLIAKASTTGAVIVTHERKVGEDSSKVKIPNICEQFGVSYIDTYSLMSLLKARLNLSV